MEVVDNSDHSMVANQRHLQEGSMELMAVCLIREALKDITLSKVAMEVQLIKGSKDHLLPIEEIMGVNLSVEGIEIPNVEVMAACLKTVDMVPNTVVKVNAEDMVLNLEGMVPNVVDMDLNAEAVVPNTEDTTANPSATTPLNTPALLTAKRIMFAKVPKCIWARETCCASKTTTCLSGPISSTSAQKHTSRKNMPHTSEEIT